MKLLKTRINMCAPAVKTTKRDMCLNKMQLLDIIRNWNRKYPDRKIKYKTGMTSAVLWEKIKLAMRNTCTKQLCLLNQDFVKTDNKLVDDLKNRFKPIAPESWSNNKTEWLSTLDIEQVINQYEEKYPDFAFLGAVPMDFASRDSSGVCIGGKLCSLGLQDMRRRGKNKIGVVFNLDEHDEKGSHWVALFCSLPKREICYWDSYAMEPSMEVKDFMKKLETQGAKMGKKMTIKVNDIRHQYKYSECGVYCIYFIISMLEGAKFEDLISNVINDDVMNKHRDIFFNKMVD